MQKAEEARPRSPMKKNAVASSLAKKIWLPVISQTNNRGRPKQLETVEKSWLLDFSDRPNITYTTPGKRNQV